MKAIQTTEGDKSAATLKLGEVPMPVPSGRQVLIKIHYTAVNRADTLQRQGSYPVPPGESTIIGLECSGEVTALADGCTGSFKVGDKVMALLGGGGYAEYAVADERSVMPIPASFGGDMEKAAAVPETWLTAYQLIHFVSKPQPGDHVVVHAAGSGVGLAACQLLKAHGCTAIATSRTADKLRVAVEHGASATVDTTAEDWPAQVIAATGGKGGADVILDPVGGSFSAGNAEAIGKDGRWVIYGLMGGPDSKAEALFAKMLRKRATIVGTTLRSRTLEYKGELVAAMSEVAFPRFESGEFKAVVDKTFPLADAGAAHAFMEANSNTGKVMLKVIE